ncbi:MAG: mitomycin resistance protein [Fuerstiella sp.]|nr:mitomycin resistance protein [Fuerstiella sp.]MCP4858538.1 mitomycin resistance protein [Fuerstiella sp.]
MKNRQLSFQRLSELSRSEFETLEQLPNIGPAAAGYFKQVDVSHPQDLVGRDPYTLFEKLCRVTNCRFDPCLLDQFISAVRFMEGDEAKPWWEYTSERKQEYDSHHKTDVSP